MDNKISVILTLYNEEKKFAEDAIKSILMQTHRELELLLVLDNPRNEELINVINYYEENDERVRAIINDKNIGLSNSINKAIKLAKGKYIARMDGDDISISTRLQKELEFLEKNKYDFVGSNAELINENSEVIWATSHGELKNDEIVKKMKYKNIFIHPSMLFKKKILIELDGYKDIKYIEDYELFTRAILYKYKCGIIKENLIQYRIRSGSITNNNALQQLLSEEVIKYNYCNALKNRSKRKKIDSIKISAKDKENYSKAFEVFKKAREYAGKKRYFKALWEVIRSINKSKYILTYLKSIIKYKLA